MYANDVTYTLKLYIYSFVCKLCNTYTYSSTYQLTLEDCWWFLLEVWCVKQIFSFFVSGVAVAETIDYSTDIIYGIINNAAGNLNFVFFFSQHPNIGWIKSISLNVDKKNLCRKKQQKTRITPSKFIRFLCTWTDVVRMTFPHHLERVYWISIRNWTGRII